MNKKFIIVQDEATALKLIASGFRLVSQLNNTYTFMNQVPQNFTFDEIDKSKLEITSLRYLYKPI